MVAPHSLSDEVYQAILAMVDERLENIIVTRQDFDHLAQGQSRLESRMDRVEASLDRLAEAQARTEERVGQLAEAVAQDNSETTALN